MKWRLSLPEPPMLVYYYAKLAGLAPFTVQKDRFYPPTLLSRVYSTCLTAIHISVAITPAITVFEKFDELVDSSFQKLRWGANQLISTATTVFTLIIYLLMYEKSLFIGNKLCDIGNELKSLGIEEDHEKFFKHVLAMTVIPNFVIIGVSVVVFLTESEWPILLLVEYITDSWLYLNVIIIFTEILLLIKQRFKLINENLYNIFRPADDRRSLRSLRIFTVFRNPSEEIRAEIDDLADLRRIEKIELLHLELCDLVDQTSRLFAVPILLNSLQTVVALILRSFYIYVNFRNSNHLHSFAEIFLFLGEISAPLLGILISMIHLLLIPHASTTTCREGNATKDVLAKVCSSSNAQDIEDELFIFSLQLVYKPVAVSVFGFLKLDYSYVYKIFCTVVAYLIILIQFDTSKSHPSH